MKFDGRGLADEIEQQVARNVAEITKKPHIVSFLVGNDPASEMYSRMKEKAADRVGIKFEIMRMADGKGLEEKIKEVGSRKDITGVMVQLPIPDLQGPALEEVLSAIPLNKDVDGLRWQTSGIIPATVRAILTVLERIGMPQKVTVVGARGVVGRPLVVELAKMGVEVAEINRDTENRDEILEDSDVIISCVGQKDLIRGEMVKDGVVAIDVGGDMTREVYEKARVSVENPGGVGPVTIACLVRSGYELAAKLK